MTRILSILATVAFCAAVGVTEIQAQERRPGGPEGPVREGGMVRVANPVIAALDTNSDGVIDEQEIANASANLKKLDKNGDGRLTPDELRPTIARGPGTPSASSSEEMIKRLMEFDKNGDGKLSKDELPERMQAIMERADTDKDGFLTREELKKMYETAQRRTTAPNVREGGERPPQSPVPAK